MPLSKQLKTDVIAAINGWRHNPERMLAGAVISGVIGQGIFWRFGSDQIGINGRSALRMGKGPAVGRYVVAKLPRTAPVAGALKLLEIAGDASRFWTETPLVRRHGISPDAVVSLVPGWPLIEAAEKSFSSWRLIKALVDGDEKEVQQQMEMSAANIYGNLFRYGLAAVLIVIGPLLARFVRPQLERLLRYAGTKAIASVRRRLR